MAKNMDGLLMRDVALSVTPVRSVVNRKTMCHWGSIFVEPFIGMSVNFPTWLVCSCPCGALQKESGGTVVIDYDTYCGHGSCVDACPYGAIYMDPVANQAVKCHNGYHRVESGMEPACVPTCPAEALHFGDLNDPDSKISTAMQRESWWTDHS